VRLWVCQKSSRLRASGRATDLSPLSARTKPPCACSSHVRVVQCVSERPSYTEQMHPEGWIHPCRVAVHTDTRWKTQPRAKPPDATPPRPQRDRQQWSTPQSVTIHTTAPHEWSIHPLPSCPRPPVFCLPLRRNPSSPVQKTARTEPQTGTHTGRADDRTDEDGEERMSELDHVTRQPGSHFGQPNTF